MKGNGEESDKGIMLGCGHREICYADATSRVDDKIFRASRLLVIVTTCE
jgi:hypothetical protein